MCLQIAPIRISQNEYSKHNKGSAGCSCNWWQGTYHMHQYFTFYIYLYILYLIMFIQLYYIHQVDDISVSTIYSEVKVGRLQLRANIVIFPAEENRPICRREFVLRNFISSHFFWYFEPRPIQAKKEQFHWSVRNSIMRLSMEVKFSIKAHLKTMN